MPLEGALGRVLAEDVAAGMDVPPFDSSAMDGFALVAGPAAELPVVGESRAGHPFGGRVEPGTAVRISTGAVVPEGADAVVPVERTEAAGERVRVPDTEAGANVRYAGEDVRADDVVIRAGTVLGPAEIGVAASLGRPRVRCAVRPRVALVVTGDELARPGEPLGPGRIYSSNGYVLAALVEQAGAVLTGVASVPDTEEGTRGALAEALEEADVVCVSGGVSVGPHDHVKRRDGGAGGRGALLGRAPASRQAHLVRRARRHARLRPARQPGVGDGDLPAVRPARRCARSRAPTPRRAAYTPPWARTCGATRGASRRCAAARAPATTGWSRRRPGRRARTC